MKSFRQRSGLRVSALLLGVIAVFGGGRSSGSPAGAGDRALADEAAVRKLAVRKCSKCHRFYDPSSYVPAVWDQWMDRMSRKSRLNPTQDRQIRAYLASLRRPDGR